MLCQWIGSGWREKRCICGQSADIPSGRNMGFDHRWVILYLWACLTLLNHDLKTHNWTSCYQVSLNFKKELGKKTNERICQWPVTDKVFEISYSRWRPVTVAGVKYLKIRVTSATVRDVSHGYLLTTVRDLWPLYSWLVTGVFFQMLTIPWRDNAC